MEEEIKLLEEKLKIIESLCTDDCINKSTVINPLKYAVENLLTRYKELEEENKQLEAIKNEAIRRYNFESIPKSKVKEKIEELKGTEELLSDEQGYWGGSDLLAKIEVLQDLLERSGEDV